MPDQIHRSGTPTREMLAQASNGQSTRMNRPPDAAELCLAKCHYSYIHAHCIVEAILYGSVTVVLVNFCSQNSNTNRSREEEPEQVSHSVSSRLLGVLEAA